MSTTYEPETKMEAHYKNNLEANSVPTLIGAKRAAYSNENVWQLQSGRFIAVAPGICVPPEAELAARQIIPGKWRNCEREY